MSKKMEQKDWVTELTQKLEKGVQDVFTSENYRNYLKVMSKFTSYSWSNTLLIALQFPQASVVAGYKKWQEMNRQVKAGEKGIRIIAPCIKKIKVQDENSPDETVDENILAGGTGTEIEKKEIKKLYFKAISVFDISQTEGDPLPSLGVNSLSGSVDEYQHFLDAVISLADVPVRFDEVPGSAKGYYSHSCKEIVLQAGMSELQTIKTVVHEVTHSKLHDKDFMKEKGIKKDRQTKEVEAESVAYIVCQHYGLDTSEYSFGYIAGWSSGRDTLELKHSLKLISDTSHTFIKGIQEYYLANKSSETAEMIA